jgi:hypothetical protein
MNSEYYQQVYSTLELKETDDLVEIWKRNDRKEWTDEAFDAIQIILTDRLGALPNQTTDQEENDGSSDSSGSEVEISPTYYSPDRILRLCKIMDIAAPVSVIVYLLANYQTLIQQILPLFQPIDDKSANIIQLSLVLLNLAVYCVILYLGLKALSSILRILLKMADQSSLVDRSPLV